MNDHAALAALLRSDLTSFVWKCFQTISPGTPYLPNWHVDAIVHQLMRVHAGEISRFLNWASLRKFLDETMLVGSTVKVFQNGVRIN